MSSDRIPPRSVPKKNPIVDGLIGRWLWLWLCLLVVSSSISALEISASEQRGYNNMLIIR